MRFFPQDNQKHLRWHAWIQEMISLPQSMTNTPIGTTGIIASTIIIHLLIFIIIIVFHWGGAWHQLFQPLRAPWGVRRVVLSCCFCLCRRAPFRLSNMYRTGTKVLIPLVCVTNLGVR